MKNLVVIGIPVYRSNLEAYERIALSQLNKILYRYPKVFIAPESLRFDYGPEYQSWQVEYFPDRYFKSIKTYSKLCLSERFYERFQIYEYLLIYQTDAFVFSDRLKEFCQMGYDYIGAPSPISVWRFLEKRVGNGGLSLRNIKKTLQVLRHKNYILQKAAKQYSKEFLRRRLSIEDQFFAYCSTLPEMNFVIPAIEQASKFAIWSEVRHSYRELETHLPFGCHGWHNTKFLCWWPIIQKFGYHLDADVIQDCASHGDEFRVTHIKAYLFERFLRRQGYDARYGIWGYGINGHMCLSFLKAYGVKIVAIYDIHAEQIAHPSCIPLKKPTDIELKARQSIIIIATAKYEAEISNHLEGLGLQRNVDFVSFYPAKTYKALGCKL